MPIYLAIFKREKSFVPFLLINILLCFALFFASEALAQKKQVPPSQTKPSQDEHIIEVVKDYLLKNPDFLLEVQDAFVKKQEEARKVWQKGEIVKNYDKIYHNKNDIVLGNPEGKKTIVEFFDYNCGYCKKNFTELHEFLKNNKNIRLILKDLPILGADSVKAHLVAQSFYKLMPNKFDTFFTQMMEHQGPINEETALDIAVKLGADKKELQKKMQDPEITAGFIANNELAYGLKISGTPAYIIGDEVFPGLIDKKILTEKLGQ